MENIKKTYIKPSFEIRALYSKSDFAAGFSDELQIWANDNNLGTLDDENIGSYGLGSGATA